MTLNVAQTQTSTQKVLSLPPGPQSLQDVLRLVRDRKRSPIALYQRLQQQYGDIVYLKIGRIETVLLNDLDAIQSVLQTQAKFYHKGPGYERLRTLIGQGLLTSEGDFWRKQRKLAAPAFHAKQIAHALSQIAPFIEEKVKSWKHGSPVSITREMNAIALEIVRRTLLGAQVDMDSEEVRKAVAEALKFADESGSNWLRMLDLLIPSHDGNLAFRVERNLPLPKVYRFKKSLTHLTRIVNEMIRSRREKGLENYGDDLLGAFMAAHDEEDGSVMNDQQLRDEVMTMLLAGHETTATALTWTWLMLHQQRNEALKVYQEVDQFWKDQGDRPLELEDLGRLPVTLHFFEETLRFYPPFWRITRTALCDQSLGGFKIPNGATILISPQFSHQDPRVWGDPHRFRPARFESHEKSTRHKFAFLSFGGGHRACIGSNFAVMEALLILVTALRHVRFELTQTGEIQTEATITLKPKGGLPAKVIRRDYSSQKVEQLK